MITNADHIYGGFFETYTGRIINLKDPQPVDFDIYDIAHALSHVCRFAGHCNDFYSVAQHCVLVAEIAPQNMKLAALLHDAPEAYLGDVLKPLKITYGEPFDKLEKQYEEAIAKAFSVPEFDHAAMKELDLKIFNVEYEAVRRNDYFPLETLIKAKGFFGTGWVWDSKTAKAHFIQAFYRYNTQLQTSKL